MHFEMLQGDKSVAVGKGYRFQLETAEEEGSLAWKKPTEESQNNLFRALAVFLPAEPILKRHNIHSKVVKEIDSC